MRKDQSLLEEKFEKPDLTLISSYVALSINSLLTQPAKYGRNLLTKGKEC